MEMIDQSSDIPPEVLELLRKVPLVGFPDIEPYRHAEISLQNLDISDIYPSAFYVLKNSLERVQNAYYELLSSGADIFSLENVVLYNNWIMAPPVIEIFDGKYTIVDGQHRIFIAKSLGIERVNIFLMTNVSAPLAVTPLEWKEVEVTEVVPKVKRIYNPAIPDGEHSKFYRDLSCFGSTGERKL